MANVSKKIPSNTQPTWQADINGKRYEYPSGKTVTVPEEVAAVIKAQEAANKTVDPDAGKLDWADLKNRPEALPYSFWTQLPDAALQEVVARFAAGTHFCVSTTAPAHAYSSLLYADYYSGSYTFVFASSASYLKQVTGKSGSWAIKTSSLTFA